MQKIFNNIDEMLIDINYKNNLYAVENKNNAKYYNYLNMCLCQIILDKKIIKRNKDLVEFLELNYKFKYSNYIKKSRMMILGKTIQIVSQIESMEEVKILLNKTYYILNHIKLDEYDLNRYKDWQDTIDKIKF